MSEYIRWEMQSLEPPKEVPPAPSPSIVQQPVDESAQRLQVAQQQAYAKGYAEGLEKGHTEGLAKGYAEGHRQGLGLGRQEGEQASARLVEIAENFRQGIQLADEQIAQDVLDLALDIAKALLKTALPVRRDLLLGLVGEIIRGAYGEQSSARLYLNPADVDLVKNELAEPLAAMDWRIVPNLEVEPGGCLVETEATQIDASLPTRWRRIVLALGRKSEWLET